MKCSELNADLMRQFAYQVTGNICPMQAVIGGIAAQEVMKVSIYLFISVSLSISIASEAIMLREHSPS